MPFIHVIVTDAPADGQDEWSGNVDNFPETGDILDLGRQGMENLLVLGAVISRGSTIWVARNLRPDENRMFTHVDKLRGPAETMSGPEQ